MTDLRKAAEMALEALESANNGMNECHEDTGFDFANEQYEVEQAIQELRQALAQPEQEPVAYTGNGTAGREADVRPTGFFFQMPKPIGEVYGWHGTGKGQPMCRFNASEAELPVGTKLYTAPPSLEVAVLAERKRIVNLFMIQHEAAKGAHNYWQVAANLIQADVASDT